MFGRKNERTLLREHIARTLRVIGTTVAGDRGARAANTISERLRCGRIDICDNPTCPNCTPTA
ncbi:hypothetical protein [Streptomyces sp. NPDC088731]|uniref:hypothetical protein n=1 Tax=Streptomyces sp. NPDC088731 TaxID=3365878 RepID=UPI0037F4322B